MQSPHLPLQSVHSQQMQSTQQHLPPQHHPQHSQHQQFQIHHLHHPQPSHHQHHQHHPQQSHQQSHHQPSLPHQQPQQHQQHHPPNSSHHLSSLHLPQASSFPSTTTPNPSNSQFHQQQQHQQHQQQQQQSHPSHFPLQSQSNLSQPSLHHQNPNPTTTSFNNSVQPLQMQPLLPSQQSSQAAFGTLANLSGSMLQAGVVDDNPTNPHHFANSQSGDALASPYPWDNAPPPHAPLASQNQNQQQQPLLPLPLVGDTRNNNPLSTQTPNQPFPGQNGSAQNSFGGALNPNMGVLGTSLNTTMVSGLVNGNSLGTNVTNVAPSLSPSGADLSQRNSFSISDGGAQRPSKTIKKARGNMAQRKTAPARVRNPRAPITSPVSTATLPNMSQPSGVASNPMDHAGVSSPHAAMGGMASSPTRQARVVAGGKAKGRMRVPSRGMDGGEVPGPGAMSSSTSVGIVPPNQTRDDPAPGSTTAAMPGTLAPQTFGDTKNATSATVAWSSPKKASTSRSRSRRKGDGTTTSLPVHLRNPKKGRARVFRECKACRHENHIRRSDCSNCKAPLPAGKRRRDGNPSYDSKRQVNAATVTAVPNAHVVAQSVGRARPGVKDDIAVSSVMTK